MKLVKFNVPNGLEHERELEAEARAGAGPSQVAGPSHGYGEGEGGAGTSSNDENVEDQFAEEPPPSMCSDDTGIDEDAEEDANLVADTDNAL